jgi:hypothetical protein
MAASFFYSIRECFVVAFSLADEEGRFFRAFSKAFVACRPFVYDIFCDREVGTAHEPLERKREHGGFSPEAYGLP